MQILFVSMTPLEHNTSATIQNKGIVRGLVALGHVVDTLTLKPQETSLSYDVSMNDIGALTRNSYFFEPDKKYQLLMAKNQVP